MTDLNAAGDTDDLRRAPEGALRLQNEFASVWVALDRSANGVRLRIADAATGQSLLMDPLQLEALAWARQADLRFLMVPSYRESVVRDLIGPSESSFT